jgi:hypothetical protein
MLNLNDFKKNVRSQGGEDGIIEKLLLEANIQTGYFVEFGAWDGRYLSNTCVLADKGWGGVFIEACYNRFKDLSRNYENSEKIVCVNAIVTTEGEGLLSRIIGGTRYAGQNPAVLSIDIDSDDLAVWKSLRGCFKRGRGVVNYAKRLSIIRIMAI